MSSLSLFEFNNEGIRFQNNNGKVLVSLTDMAKASNKRVNDWTRLDATVELLEGLESIAGIPVIDSKVGGAGIPENERGTWAIEEVAIEFAGWCNVRFKIWMIQKIKELLTTGKVELREEKSTLDEKLDLIRKAQAIINDVPELNLRFQALTAIDEESQSKYGFSIYPKSFQVPPVTEVKPIKVQKSVSSEPLEIIPVEKAIKPEVVKDDLYYLKQIAKVIGRITAGKAIRETFCMSSMTSRNAALKAAGAKEKARLNNIMYHLIEMGILECPGTTRKDSPYFLLVKRYTPQEIVSKYKKYMIGVTS
jgi:KilA-N domain